MVDGMHDVRGEVRVIALTMEDIGHGWVVTLRVEPRTGRGKKRALLKLVDRWHAFTPRRIDTRDALDELLAEAVLQRRLPGID